MSYIQNNQSQVQRQNKGSQNDNIYTNDNMLQIANIFMTKSASISFLELQGVNGRKFILQKIQ